MKVCMKYRICKNIEQKYRIKIWKTVKKLFAHKNQFFLNMMHFDLLSISYTLKTVINLNFSIIYTVLKENIIGKWELSTVIRAQIINCVLFKLFPLMSNVSTSFPAIFSEENLI